MISSKIMQIILLILQTMLYTWQSVTDSSKLLIQILNHITLT